ncbi:hypothetical protein [Marinicella meishanensis]|uniref:hypothetical protein n=1 Tax=Marinicella meishanensis TaxID=2873263 RepID=UPI001CBE44F2|nr:hypothetical protein [Marinicella sp. NBU2979]
MFLKKTGVVLLLLIPLSSCTKTLRMEFNEGEMISLISAVEKENSFQMKQAYFMGIFPILVKHDIQQMGTLRVVENLTSEHDTIGFDVLKIPNTGVKQSINVDRIDDWLHLRRMRPTIWNELRIADYEASEDIMLELNSEKLYQVEAFWINQDFKQDFLNFAEESYETNSPVSQVLVLGKPNLYETLGTERAPDYWVINEWEDRAPIDEWVKTKTNMIAVSKYNSWIIGI